jgi:CrcB protein
MAVNNFLLIGAGGAIGSMLRYAISLLAVTTILPYATFIVNVTGSLIIGLLLGLSEKNIIGNYAWKFLAVGICGGFTTFSALSLESFKLLQQQRYFIFSMYIVVSIIAGLLSTYAGYILSK